MCRQHVRSVPACGNSQKIVCRAQNITSSAPKYTHRKQQYRHESAALVKSHFGIHQPKINSKYKTMKIDHDLMFF